MNKRRYFYLRDEKRFPIALVATELIGNEVHYAVSTWNPRDAFDRQMARRVVDGRLEKSCLGKVIMGIRPKERVVVSIAYDARVPGRTRRAAANWLQNRRDHAIPDATGTA